MEDKEVDSQILSELIAFFALSAESTFLRSK